MPVPIRSVFDIFRHFSPRRQAHLHPRAGRLGMTLIEIMIVVTIMAAIIGTATVFLFRSNTRANINLATTDSKRLLDQVKTYTISGPSKKPPSNLEQLVKDNFADEIPLDPWGNPYTLSVQGSKATVTSSGPDGSPGTDDDIASEGNLR